MKSFLWSEEANRACINENGHTPLENAEIKGKV